MNKKELINAIAEKTGLTKVDIEKILVAQAEAMTTALIAKEEVFLPGIGRLRVKLRKERSGRNPQTGEASVIPAKNVITTSFTSTLKAAINE